MTRVPIELESVSQTQTQQSCARSVDDTPRSSLYFKFATSCNVLKILASGKLKISPPQEFNDPFEFHPVLAPMDRAKAAALMKGQEGIERVFRVCREKGWFEGSIREFTRLVENDPSPFIRIFSENSSQASESMADYLKRDINDKFRVLCLVRKYSEVLMWSHYADSHRGAVIGFHSKTESFSVAHRCCYASNRRPILDYTISKKSSQWQKQAEDLIRTKGPKWFYEKEVRFLYRTEPADFDRKLGFHCWRIPSGTVKMVIFGCRCDPKQIDEIKAVAQAKHPGVLFKRARIHPERFKLTFVAA